MTGNNNLIIGIGNEMRGDDALGIIAVNDLKERFPNLAEYCIVQGDPTRLIDRWESKDVVIIDAIQSARLAAGTLHLVRSLDKLLTQEEKLYSSHSIGLKQALELGKYLQKLPASCFFVGVTGKNWKFGAPLSNEVKHSLPKIIASILSHIRMNEPNRILNKRF